MRGLGIFIRGETWELKVIRGVVVVFSWCCILVCFAIVVVVVAVIVCIY